MADFYTTLTGATPTQQDILEAELLARQTLEAAFPDLDLREGTGLRDTLIRPSAFLLAMVKRGLEDYMQENSLAQVTDDSPTELVDRLLGNWFLRRDLGTLAIINARLYFARQKSVTVPAGTSFSTDGSTLFFPSDTIVLPSSAMQYDSFDNEWYVDIELQAAETGSAYNVGQGSLLYFSTFDPYFLHAEINFLVRESVASETNTAFVTRSSSAINTRNLINKPSIEGKLLTEFNYVRQVESVGAKDAYMYRDQFQVVLSPTSPRKASTTTYSGGRIRVGLTNHGLFSGQKLVLTGAVPSDYNQEGRVVTVGVDFVEISTLVVPPGPCVTTPSVTAMYDPVWAHLGGKVDVYCDAEIVEELQQITLDVNGRATVQGPVIKVERSQTTSSPTPDTLPWTTPIPGATEGSGYSFGATWIDILAPAHGQIASFKVFLDGFTQTRIIQSISCNDRLVTVVSPNHGIPSGATVQITGVVPSEYQQLVPVTALSSDLLTFVSPIDILSSGTGSTMRLVNPSINGVRPAVAQSNSIIRASVGAVWSGVPPTSSSATAGLYADFSQTVPSRIKGFAQLSSVGNLVTAVCHGHAVVPGRQIQIDSSSSYAGVWSVDSVPNNDSFTFSTGGLLSSAVESDTIFYYTKPPEDVGFSSRQTLVVDFGSSHAGKTVTMSLTHFKNVDNIQNFLDLPENRVTCADYLARGFNLYLLTLNLVTYASGAPSSAEVANWVSSFLATLTPGQPLIVSDLLSHLSAKGLDQIQSPVQVQYSFHQRDLFAANSGVFTDYLDPRDSTAVFTLGNLQLTQAKL